MKTLTLADKSLLVNLLSNVERAEKDLQLFKEELRLFKLKLRKEGKNV
jgi:hypothetical protein